MKFYIVAVQLHNSLRLSQEFTESNRQYFNIQNCHYNSPVDLNIEVFSCRYHLTENYLKIGPNMNRYHANTIGILQR